MLLLLKSYW